MLPHLRMSYVDGHIRLPSSGPGHPDAGWGWCGFFSDYMHPPRVCQGAVEGQKAIRMWWNTVKKMTTKREISSML